MLGVLSTRDEASAATRSKDVLDILELNNLLKLPPGIRLLTVCLSIKDGDGVAVRKPSANTSERKLRVREEDTPCRLPSGRRRVRYGAAWRRRWEGSPEQRHGVPAVKP
ncbi:hypothetical protein GUJ93_ZPchr0008g11573 [Zizania palustris]|uniref:Uncharacterized protein n=1 Tax=Zizania palustris TaxID=103762 RepID=A0A8J5RIU0_ZIZPA|nr:hypothetical protein GUJ93_ZPchr0008g11573 [Zizania palustris]